MRDVSVQCENNVSVCCQLFYHITGDFGGSAIYRGLIGVFCVVPQSEIRLSGTHSVGKFLV